MKAPIIAVTTVAAATVLVGVSVPGCSSKSNETTASSSASATSTSAGTSESTSAQAQPADYSDLLVDPGDIAPPGDTLSAEPPIENPSGKPGVATVFSNQDGTRQIGDTILILPDAAGAAAAVERSKASFGDSVTGGEPEPVPVGSGGTMISGMSPDGSKSVTVLVFSEGKAFTTLEFDGAPDDPVPPPFAIDVGQKQDAAIKSGLPG